jgi:hypothetical protein
MTYSRRSAHPRVSLTALRSVLESRIDQAIAITPPEDAARLELLCGIRDVDSLLEQLASFTGYLIDYAAFLALTLNQSHASGHRSHFNSSHDLDIHKDFDADYRESLAL